MTVAAAGDKFAHAGNDKQATCMSVGHRHACSNCKMLEVRGWIPVREFRDVKRRRMVCLRTNAKCPVIQSFSFLCLFLSSFILNLKHCLQGLIVLRIGWWRIDLGF